MGYLFGCGIVCRSDEHFATGDECHLLAVRRNGCRGGSIGKGQAGCIGPVVADNLYLYFLRGGAILLGIYFTVVTIAQCSVAAYGEEAHGMGLETAYRFYRFGVCRLQGVHIERTAVALAQEVQGLSVRREDGVAVFARVAGEVGVLLCTAVVHPYVACNGRGVVLPPLVFKSFLVLVEKHVARFVEAEGFGGSTQYLFGASAGCGDFIKLGHGRTGEERTSGRVLYGGGEKDILAVGRECGRDFSCRVGGQALCRTAIGRHYEDVEVSLPVAGKRYLFAVRRPYGRRFVRLLRGELRGRTAFCGNFVDVSLVTENDFRTVG